MLHPKFARRVPILNFAFFAKFRTCPELVEGGILQVVTLHVDCEVVDWFKSKGPSYQTRMNRILRKVMVEGKRGRGDVTGGWPTFSIGVYRPAKKGPGTENGRMGGRYLAMAGVEDQIHWALYP